jgi:hypothetical protein
MHLLMIAALLLPTGCGDTCPLGIVPGIVLDVQDKSTNEALAAGAIAVVERIPNAGAAMVVDTLRGPMGEQNPFGSQMNSTRVGPGTYRVVVKHEGYETLTIEPVVVSSFSGDCGGVVTTHLRADLVATQQ